MTNLKQMYVRMELAFWARTIPLLQENEVLHRVIAAIYLWIDHQRWVLRLPRPVLWSVAGVTIGFIFGLLGGILF